MTALQLTAYELGARDPAEHFPEESRIKIIRREQTPVTRGPSQAERDRRQQLAARVRQTFPSTEAMGRALNVKGGSIAAWFSGRRPVPDRYVATLEKLAGGEA